MTDNPETRGLHSAEHAADPESQRIQEFMVTLGAVQQVRTLKLDIDFDDEAPILFSQKRFQTYEHDEELSLYLDPEMGSDEELPLLGFSPRVSRARPTNHGLFFGDMHIGEENILPVAVKPHTGNATKTCLDEFFKTAAVRQQGVYTLKPAGFILGQTDSERAYSFTVLEEGLSTLDSIDWSPFYPHMSSHPGMQEMWRGISGQLADLHKNGDLSQGDMTPRNIATTPEGGLFFIDWELAHISKQGLADSMARFSHSYGDLVTLLEAMCRPPHIEDNPGIGIFYGKPGDWWQGFSDIFFDEYRHVRLELAKQGRRHKETEKTVKEELAALEIKLKADCRELQELCETIPPPAFGPSE